MHAWDWFSEDASRAELTIAVLVAFEVVVLVLWPVGAYCWRRLQLRWTFKMEFPEGSLVTAISDPHGSIPTKVRIHLRCSTEMQDIHFRFAKNKRGEPVSSDTISIEGLQSPSRLGVSPHPDGKGGCWGLVSTLRIYPDQAIDLLLAVRAMKEWSGYLVFTGRDEGEHVRTISAPFAVKAAASAGLGNS
jgi:hypothetical protein